jgi:hypothetical protein
MSDEPTYDPREVRLTLRIIEEFGEEVALAQVPDVRWEEGDPIVQLGNCELALGKDDHTLFVRYWHAGVKHYGVRENGGTKWLGKIPAAPPEWN